MPSSLSGPSEPCLWANVLNHLQPPDGDCRVLALELGDSEVFGCGPVKINPWLNPDQLHAPSGGMSADELTSFGVPLSLALALERDIMQEGMLTRPDFSTHHE